MIGIICPSRFEYEVLEHSALNPSDVRLVCSGMGKVRSVLACHKLIHDYQVTQVLVIGFAGALSPDLHIGDRIEPEDYIEYDYRAEPFEPYPNILECSLKPVYKDSKRVTLLTQDCFLTRNPLIGTEFESRFPSVACDMESYAVKYFCEDLRIPCRVIRIISDIADEKADHDFLENCRRLSGFLNETVEGAVRYLQI